MSSDSQSTHDHPGRARRCASTLAATAVLVLASGADAQGSLRGIQRDVARGARLQPAALPACEWCGAPEAPARLGSEVRLAGAGEPGTPLVVSGTIYQPDGHTPAPGVLVYAYHANAAGVYPRRGDETGNGRRHGYLRGWLRTDARGRYRIVTIRPAAYATREEPAHVHMTVTPPGRPECWVDSVMFDDDPLLTAAARARLPRRGGPGVVHAVADGRGGLRASRDVVLTSGRCGA